MRDSIIFDAMNAKYLKHKIWNLFDSTANSFFDHIIAMCKKAYLITAKARQTTVSWFLKITWAAKQNINLLRVMLCSSAHGLFEHQIPATSLALLLRSGTLSNMYLARIGERSNYLFVAVKINFPFKATIFIYI